MNNETIKIKRNYVTFCFICKKHKDSNLFRPNAKIQSCFDCARKEYDRLSKKGITLLRKDEQKAIMDFSKTISYEDKGGVEE